MGVGCNINHYIRTKIILPKALVITLSIVVTTLNLGDTSIY